MSEKKNKNLVVKSSKEVGRPTSYKKEYCELLIEHMSKGLSYEAFAGSIGVSKQTIYDWEKVNPEFLDAKYIGTEKSRIFWESLGINHILNVSESFGKDAGSKSVSLNAPVWVFNMKNRFGWKDKQPEETDTLNINLTLADKMAKARKRIGDDK